jgi:hypothetical protein
MNSLPVYVSHFFITHMSVNVSHFSILSPRVYTPSAPLCGVFYVRPLSEIALPVHVLCQWKFSTGWSAMAKLQAHRMQKNAQKKHARGGRNGIHFDDRSASGAGDSHSRASDSTGELEQQPPLYLDPCEKPWSGVVCINGHIIAM